ncbi:MAG: M56 family metallopeptidase [Lachnospiraceae bacterium]|nr:M56 family metallopeptidase [Lachnospiraceae bacterium]
MNLIFRTVLAMSLSGALLILLLFFGRVVLKNRLSRQWQYYIWLIVLIRLWIPFGPEASLMGRVDQAAGSMIAQMMQEVHPAGQNGGQDSEGEGVQNPGQSSGLDEQQNTAQSVSRSASQRPSQFAAEKPEKSVTENGASLSEGMALAGKYLWVIWLTVALGMLIRKISMYQSYIRYVRAGAEPVSDVALLDRLSVTAQEMGIGRAIELCVNPHVASPMLVGYFHPCIVLPCADVQERKFCYMAMHELTHYKRRDIFYKWLVQLTVCLHWFNPFVYWMRREMERACEFACDEAVVIKMGHGHAADYGETLLDAMAAAGTYSEPLAAVTMSANKELLRERLGAIMSCKKKTKRMGMITAGLTVCIVLAAFFLGVYPAAAAETKNAETEALSVSDKTMGTDYDDRTLVRETSGDAGEKNVGKEIPVQEKSAGTSDEAATDAEKYYRGRSLPQFYIAFCRLNEKEQEAWLDRIYADDATQFFSVSVKALDADSPLIQSFAEKCYADGSIAFFSILVEVMDKETLEGWLDRSLADQKLNFQSMLYDKLDMDEEWDEVEKALEEEQLAQYQAVGVTKNGKNYYYQGQLVNIFLDIHRPNRSFYTLSMNPAGTVNVKIIRAQDGQITGAAYLTEAEIEELFGDMEEDVNAEADEEAEAFPQEMTVAMPVCKLREGAGGEMVVGLIGEGETVTVLGKEEGEDGQMWYLLDRESLSEQPDDSVKVCYIRADLLK